MDKVNMIDGTILTPLKIIDHPLGDVFHGMKSTDNGFLGFEEAYFSTIQCGVIKPWKKHINMTLNLIVPVGEVKFVLYDDRLNSKTNGQFMDVSLSLKNYHRLTVPPNVWMAFKGEDTNINLLLNIANMEHDPQEVVRTDLNKIKFQW